MAQKGQNSLLRRISLLTVASLLSAGLTAGAPAVSAGGGGGGPKIVVKNGKTQPVFDYKDAIRETVYVESLIDEDGVPGNDLLATDIIRPKGSGSSFRVSSIYEMSPYYQNIFNSSPVQLGRGNEHEPKEEQDDFVPEVFPLYYDNFFVPRGYAFIAQDAPGTRNSEGCMTLGGDGELAAAKATMRWLNGKGKAYTYKSGSKEEVKATWSNGKAGMIGKSYDATIANAAASMGLPGLKTIVPTGGISRWYDYMFNNGVQYQGNTSTGPLFTYYIDSPPPDDDERNADWILSTTGQNSVCAAQDELVVAGADDPEGTHDAFWHERDYLRDPKERPDCPTPALLPDCIDPSVFPSNAKNVKASVFITHGRNDWNVKPQNWFQWWKHLKKADVPIKMWLSQTGHVDPFDFRREKWVNTLHRWFDKWLYGVNNGIMSEPLVDIEVAPNKWKSYGTWPSRGRRMARLWLGPKDGKRLGTLSLNRPAEGKTQSYVDNPVEGSWENYVVSDPGTEKEERLMFLTKKLNKDVRVSGQFKIWLSATLDRPDTNFTFYLIDYGKGLRVAHDSSDGGIRTSTTKESCHGQSTQKDDACYFVTEPVVVTTDREVVTRGWLDARHRKNARRMEPLTPGEKYMFRWTAMGEDYVFEEGHQIGVMIGGSDSDWTVPDSQQGANIEVHLHESKVRLPIVGRLRGINF